MIFELSFPVQTLIWPRAWSGAIPLPPPRSRTRTPACPGERQHRAWRGHCLWPSPHTRRNPRWLRRSHLRHTAILLWVPHPYKNKRVPAQLNNVPKKFVAGFYCSSQNYPISPLNNSCISSQKSFSVTALYVTALRLQFWLPSFLFSPALEFQWPACRDGGISSLHDTKKSVSQVG